MARLSSNFLSNLNRNRHPPMTNLSTTFCWGAMVLHMRIEDRPLAFPIAAHPIAPVDVATFHSICPNHIGMHGRKDSLDVATIEELIDSP